MKSEIVNDVVGYLESQNIEVNDVYFENICRDVNVHFNMSYLPDIAYIKYIDDKKSGSNVVSLLSDFYKYVNRNECVTVLRENANDDVFIASSLIGRYIGDSLIRDTRIHKILYVDTPLLLTDYKRMMDGSVDSVNPPALFHPIELLNSDIYKYDYVIWDRFNLANSNYDLNKLSEIVHHRYLSMRGNLFFNIGKSATERAGGIDDMLKSSMNIVHKSDLLKDKCSYKNTEQYERMLNETEDKEVK